jgi:hypothetical protein
MTTRNRRSRSAKRAGSDLTDHPFITFEPASKRKLNCFPDEDCLLQVLGHHSKKLQDWLPDDRAIDSIGKVFRLIPDASRKHYDLEPTGEAWTWHAILDLACQDAAWLKRDPKPIREQVERAPDVDKIVTIMQIVDQLTSGAILPWIGLWLFLLLFFLTVMFGAGYFIMWLQKITGHNFASGHSSGGHFFA